MALAILGLLSPDELALAIAARDKATLTRVSGVGPKLAERMLTELKDKAPVGDMSVSIVGAGAGGSSSASDAVSALVNLGYRQSEAFGVVSDAARRLGDEATVGDLIQAGLKELSA
jgi:Holliday junction DNA helicase RuvA